MPPRCRRCATAAQDKELRDPDFWCHAGQVELDVYQALAAHRLAGALDGQHGIATRYTDLHNRVASLSMWGSVADTAALVLPPYAQQAGKAEAAAALRLLALVKGSASG